MAINNFLIVNMTIYYISNIFYHDQTQDILYPRWGPILDSFIIVSPPEALGTATISLINLQLN